ncbi:MAG TPA: zinc ribbon domain-containing protein, partial [Ktedonobacterales bacterium]|nr:zinc ribbon domain-containing protein [Ktedonobacterales bacterium]
MICPHCGTANAANARFCVSCGQPLPRRCPNCGALNPPTARFCNQCGFPLEGQPAPTLPPTPAESPAEVTAASDESAAGAGLDA